jgi:HSP20 family molecular chaperone IbpA
VASRCAKRQQLDRAAANVQQCLNEVQFVPRSLTTLVADFQRDFDELFDELLIGPWRLAAAGSEPPIVMERHDAYEVRICTGAFKPSELDVVVTEKNLTVKARHADNSWERTLTFNDPVRTEKVQARWAQRVLTVILPKKQKRPRTERK